MATYAVGDVQGCHRTLRAALERVQFDRRADRLWLAGDMVNRGPDSLGVLRLLADMGDRVTAVLGNHELHLLGVVDGVRALRPADTLGAVLDAPDRDALLAWLSERPLVHREDAFLMVHAGLLPEIDWDVAVQQSTLATQMLAGEGRARLIGAMAKYPTQPWTTTLEPITALVLAAAAFTRVRVLRADGSMDTSYTGGLDTLPVDRWPWFAHPKRKPYPGYILFGHWAALGLHLGQDVICLDSGCGWGRALTLYRLDDGAVFQQPNIEGNMRPMSLG